MKYRATSFMAAILLVTSMLNAHAAKDSSMENNDVDQIDINEQVETGSAWEDSKNFWEKHVNDINDGKEIGPELVAEANYEYGRALGVLCEYDLAEKHLLISLEADRKSNSEVSYIHMNLTELSRLMFDQKKYKEAVDYFSQAVEAMEEIDIEKNAPAAFTEFLDEYAVALRNLGREAEAQAVVDRTKKIRAEKPNIRSLSKRTPYGSECNSLAETGEGKIKEDISVK